MKKILVDINVLLDFLQKREGHSLAALIVEAVHQKKVEGYLGAHEVTTLSYFLQKELGKSPLVVETLHYIVTNFTITPLDLNIIEAALLSPMTDFEDAILEVSALNHQLSCIVTRNVSDFTRGRVKAVTPKEWLDLLREEN